MRTLQFLISGQKLKKVGDFSNIVPGTKGYLKCSFDFDGDDWMNHKIVAIFENANGEFYEEILPNRTCKVPDEVTDKNSFKLRLVGAKFGDINSRLTTNRVLICQEG